MTNGNELTVCIGVITALSMQTGLQEDWITPQSEAVDIVIITGILLTSQNVGTISPEGRPGISDVSPRSGISGLSV